MATIMPCRSCGAKMFFATTKTGKSVPLDAEPAENGNYLLGDDGIASVLPKGSQVAVGTPLYISHFATCPDAQKYRKKGA